MGGRELAGLACKVLGLFLVMQGVNLLSNAVYLYISVPVMETDILPAVLYQLGYLVSGVLLWVLAGQVAALMVRGRQDGDGGEAVSAAELQRLAFSVLGLYFAGNALPKLVRVVTNIYAADRWMPGTPAVYVRDLAGVITELLIGIGCFFGARGLVNLLRFLRQAGPGMKG